MYKISINKALGLKKEYFVDSRHDMESLVNDNQQCRQSMQQAADLCEKFHSYLHFEESYMQCLAGDFYQKERDLAAVFYKEAIRQDHCNLYAYQQLAKIYSLQGNTGGYEQLKSQSQTYGVMLAELADMELTYQRPYQTFAQYLAFALNKVAAPPEKTYDYFIQQKIIPDAQDDFWLCLACYQLQQNQQNLQQAIAQLKTNHALYHRAAAQIYYNLYELYRRDNKEDIARALKQRASNIDLTFSAL